MFKRNHVRFCAGCGPFDYNPETPSCNDSQLDLIWWKCPCRRCLIKTMCTEECNEIKEYKEKPEGKIKC
jgi:hypothetical protein